MPLWSATSFTGGMNDVIDASLLEPNTAVNLVNARVRSGKLVPDNAPLDTKTTAPEDHNHYGSRHRSAVKYYGRNYWCVNDWIPGSSAPSYGGDKEDYLGIPYPTYGNNKLVRVATVAGGTTSLKGTYCYAVTYVSVNGWEGAPGDANSYMVQKTLDHQDVTVTVSFPSNIKTGQVVKAKVWRTVDKGADFYCVGEVTTSGGTFTDTNEIKDTMLITKEHLPESAYDRLPPAKGHRFICEFNGVFFMAGNADTDDKATLYYSQQGNPHAWPTLNFLGLDDEITGIVPEFQGVLVFTRNRTYRITGADDPATLVKAQLPGEQGCVNWRTISRVSNAPIWLSNDGICMWDGESLSIPSLRVIETRGIIPQCACSADDTYYLFITGGAIVFSRRDGDTFRKAILPIEVTYAWYNADDDRMLVQVDSGEIYAAGEGPDRMELNYLSPYIGGATSAYKNYQEVYVVCEKTASMKVTVDGAVKVNVSLVSGRNRVKMPQGTLGRYAQIELKSYGEIDEIGMSY